MKRHPPRHRSKPPQSAIPERSSQPIRRSSEAKFSLGTFVWTRPLAILGGAWVVMLVVALIAVNGLLSPDSSNGKRMTGGAIVRSTAETTQLAKRQSRLPLWLFGAIALSCAAGSILISKQAVRPPRPYARPQRRTSPKHLKHDPAPDAPALEPSLPPAPHPPAPATMPSFALAPRLQSAAATASVAPVTLMELAQMQSHAAPVQPSTVVSVTVVPSEEKAPLDWGEASLADKLDLRKQRSISSLL